MAIDEVAFEQVKKKIIGVDRQRLGIGTLSEKTVHAILKNYYEPDEDKQEIPIENYVADIYTEGEIIEIQTRQFNRMRDKLRTFLPLYPVTIVYPIPREKYLIWIDEESGELSKKRKSPQKGTSYTAFVELYKIKMFLKEPNLRLKLVLMDMEEYRILNGWSKDKKKGSSRFDRIPVSLVEEVDITCIEDYMQFVPVDLEEPFTVKDFARAAHIPASLAGTVVHILAYVGMIYKVGTSKRAYLYQVADL
ncbi:MAG: hypothetical protein NC081_08580 [Roseburia sp.]|nr:hypothetical protein [Bacteroides sp.]MCM1569487.1 hypothetical protein [Roseburia sp.]